MSALDIFRNRLTDEWLVPFCKARTYSHKGFVGKSVDRLSMADARDFMEALDRGLVLHHDGVFSAPLSKAKEQIFWQGIKCGVPRKVTLWVEPIITMAGLFRLNQVFGWPPDRLGMQSKTWAFDLVGYREDRATEIIECEVKKTEREVDGLVALMERHASTPAETLAALKGAERNAFKKVLGLRKSKSAVFWALGPKCYSRIFDVIRDSPGVAKLRPTGESALFYKKFQGI